MSSKTKPQKPATQKPEAGNETADTAASTEVTAAGDGTAAEAPQADDATQADAAAPADDADKANQPVLPDEPEATAPEPVAVIETVAAVPADGLSIRLTRTVSAILTSGKPEAVHALHKVELIVGTLKTSLGAAIEACDAIGDEALKADLNSLLAAL